MSSFDLGGRFLWAFVMLRAISVHAYTNLPATSGCRVRGDGSRYGSVAFGGMGDMIGVG